ncbi:lytic transglycosylase domain-containing protein [Tranquillimonas alkanivorans]|uniref:Transglycosylase SLT domain-containing protein n=1 Tax=Tranquillimonas alkanivorans TaxID=441119 RepID=A0A1I5M9L9_9RHOB|nr:lytic transglycosylase domain-containing protein [Tranquillimonas alkanivorans]SFP06235.1 Transglycosylase SLT domain-containing protein [Tranquillimonas alkanivorans]
MRAVLVAALILLAAPVAAEPPPFPEFTFKRVAPPAPGVTRRITVQITPKPPAPPEVPREERPPEDDRPLRDGHWFWSAVDPGLGADPYARTALALDVLAREAPPAPRLDALNRIAATHGPAILKATVGTRVSPALALAVIAVESGGRPAAVSPAGAQGLMQLVPATAARFGVSDSFIASDNIRGGVAYLDWLLKEFRGDAVLALAGYNAGENAVLNHGGVPPFAETQDYVPKVLAAWRVARALCVTPPELLSDGCVFLAGQGG